MTSRTSGPPRAWRRACPAGALAVALGLLSACGSLAPDTQSAAATAAAFHRALSDDDGNAACAVLAPTTIEALEGESGEPCDQAVLEEDVPDADEVEVSQAYGQLAQVVLDEDVVFLASFGDRWLITAAGCRARDSRPYQCSIEGG